MKLLAPLWLIVSLLVVIASSPLALGQASPEPRSIKPLTTRTATPGPQQRADIEAYVRYHAQRLAADDLATSEDARRELSALLRTPGVTLVFRNAIAKPLIEALRPVIAQDERPMAAFNAIQIISLLATQQALDVMRDHCSVGREGRPALRLRAAIGMQNVIAHAGDNVLFPRDEASAVRDLRAAAEAETVGWVLHRQFDALANIGGPQASSELDAAFETVVVRLQQGGATDHIGALHPAVVHMRNRVVNDPRTAGTIAPMVTALLRLPLQHWAGVKDDDAMRDMYGHVITVAEGTAQVIDKTMQSRLRRAELASSLANRDRDRYSDSYDEVKAALGGN